MKPVDRYVDEVLQRVFARPEDRERLEADLRSHFAAGEAEGRPVREIIDGLGSAAEVAAAFNAEREFRYAGFWQRFVAFLGDFGLLMWTTVPVIGLGFLMGVIGEEPSNVSVLSILLCGLLFLALMGIWIFYFPLLEAHSGRTLGKHLMRIRVVRESGAPIGLGQAFVRRLSLFFEMLWIDALFIPFTEKKQRALDVIARTVVAREPGQTASAGGYFLCLLLPVAALCSLLCLALLCAPPG